MIVFYMFGIFVLGFVFGILFGVFIADKVKADLGRSVGKRRF